MELLTPLPTFSENTITGMCFANLAAISPKVSLPSSYSTLVCVCVCVKHNTSCPMVSETLHNTKMVNYYSYFNKFCFYLVILQKGKFYNICVSLIFLREHYHHLNNYVSAIFTKKQRH